MDGDELYALVEAYERLGIHRAGTQTDRATFDWYEQHLRALGLSTERSVVPFDRYVYESELTADGEPVEHLPLFYEWTGSVDTTDVALIDLGDEQRRFGSSDFEATELVAATAGRLAAFNTDSADEFLTSGETGRCPVAWSHLAFDEIFSPRRLQARALPFFESVRMLAPSTENSTDSRLPAFTFSSPIRSGPLELHTLTAP